MGASARFCALALALTVGCGRSHEAEEGRGTVVGPSVEIPLEPRTQIDEWLAISVPEDWTSPVPVEASATMTFARGPRYPETVEAHIAGASFGRCTLDGTVSITGVAGSGGGVTATQASADSYRITVVPGSPDRTIHVTGVLVVEDPFCPTAAPDGALELAFDLWLEVRSREVHGVELSPPHTCRTVERMAYFTDTRLGGIRYAPIDREGRRFLPANATPERPVDLTVTARDGLELSVGPDRDLGSVQLPGSPTMVDIAGPTGPSTAIEVVDPAIVIELDHAFQLDTWVPPARLADGDVVDGAAFEDTLLARDRIFAAYDAPQRLDGEPLCSVPSPALFELRSLTPDVCAAQPYTGADLTHLSGVHYAYATLDRDGTCALAWSAPVLNGGRGLGGRIEVAVVNADSFTDAE